MGDEEPSKAVTRETLYEEVWTTPVHLLAPKYGLSDRGLAKFCARENVPVPPRGYWAKLRAGHPVPRTPLPPAGARDERTAEMIPLVAQPDPAPEPVAEPFFSRDIEALMVKLVAAGPIAARADLRGQHTAIRAIAEARREYRSTTSTRGGNRAWTSVSDAPGLSSELERSALLLLDALARRGEEIGIPFEPGDHRGVSIEGTLLGVTFTLYVYEPVKRVKCKPRRDDSWPREWEFVHSGRLDMGIVRSYSPDRGWQGSAERLAERLDEVLPVLLRVVDAELRLQADIARRRREDEERARQRAADEAARQAERQRRQTLLDESAMWRAVAVAREYVAAVEIAHATSTGSADGTCEHAKWISWARGALDAMAPVPRRAGNGLP